MNTSAMSRPRRGTLSNEPIVVLVLVLLGFYFARELLLPFAIALTLSFLLTPAVIWFERLRLSRVPAVLLVFLMALTLVVGVGWTVTRQLLGVVNDLPKYQSNIDHKVSSLHPSATGSISQAMASLRGVGDELAADGDSSIAPERAGRRELERGTPQPVTIVTPPESSRQYIRALMRPVLRPLGMFGMIVIFTIYMLLKREDLRNRLLLLAGVGRLNVMTQALNDAGERISRYLVVNVLVNIGYGIVFAACLYVLHVPNATLWGALLAILRMVPYVGTMAVGALTIAFTLAAFPSWLPALWVFLLFGCLEFMISNFVEPVLYGSHTGISALALIIMAIVWTLLWGWPGLIVSTPLTVCLIVLGRYVPQMSFLHILLGEEAELEPEAKFYERLLAMDQTEAHNIADQFLAKRKLVDLYDDIVMPALIMTEQDRHKGVLDEVRSSYLFQSATELIAELTDYKAAALEPACATPADLDGSASSADQSPIEEVVFDRCCPVICVPSHDQADEIAATMFAQLLEQCGHKTILLPAVSLSPEILTRLGEEPGTFIAISAVPPFAFAHARTLALKLRETLPKNRMLIGLWGGAGDADTLRERFGIARPEAVAFTLEAALAAVRATAHPDMVYPAMRKQETRPPELGLPAATESLAL